MTKLEFAVKLSNVVLSVAAATALSFAQVGPVANAQTEAAAPVTAWVTQCVAAGRNMPLNCSMEQRVTLAETGQQITKLTIGFGLEEPHEASLLIQLPLGLSIRAGLSLRVDETELAALDIQTCDASGCFAGSVLDGDLLSGMRAGSQLNLVFQNLKTEEINIGVPLDGFSAAFDSVK